MQQQYLTAMGIPVWLDREQLLAEEKIEHKIEHKVEQKTTSLNYATSAKTLESLRETVAACQQCALQQSRTQTVFGVGSQHADLLLVGEAPGAQEERLGEPFVGRAGQLLDKMLQVIDLQREQVYMTNVLKCRPPMNRDPKSEEVACCTSYLEQQVALLKPKLIVALGRVAAHYLLGVTTPLDKLRGHEYPFAKTEVPILVTHHPAYLLRNPRDKSQSFVDFQSIAEKLKKS